MSPRAGTPLIHPDMVDSLEDVGFFPDTVTIEENTHTLDSKGTAQDSWAARAGMSDLACRVAPLPRSARETRTEEGVWSQGTHKIVIAGHHPTILPENRAVVNGSDVHDIEVVNVDAEDIQTVIETRVVIS